MKREKEMNEGAMLQVLGAVALVAALIDFVAVVIWFQRGEPGKAVGLLVTGIVLLLVSLNLVFQPAKPQVPETNDSLPASPAVNE